MSEFKGTPGEWYVRYGGTGDYDGFGIASKGIAGVEMEHSIVAEHWPCTVTLPSRQVLAANAHLIAAAPTMLDALNHAFAAFVGAHAADDSVQGRAREVVKAAIARATKGSE